ncbi:MAG: carbohydrate ABC transporter substrate-binding protein [Clostridiales bacterium]|nr:carbohydrate ABC transporter substrate-binding protein [Clostridiales bacterium]
MKRIISLLLCTMLMLASFTMPALASEGRNFNVVFTNGEKELEASRVVTTADAVYALVSNSRMHDLGFARWKPETNQMDILISDNVVVHGFGHDGAPDSEDDIALDHLFTNGNEVYAFDEMTMTVRRLIDADGEVAVSDILYSLMEEKYTDGFVNHVFAQEDELYLNINTREGKQLVAWYDLASGQLLGQTVLSDQLVKLSPYKDHKLLMTCYDSQSAYDPDTGETNPLDIVLLDLQTNESQVIAKTKTGDDGGVVYGETSNNIYFMSGSEIYALVNQAAPYVLCGYMPVQGGVYSRGALVSDDLYVYASSLVFVRQLQPAGIQGGALRISGFGVNEHVAAIRNNPQIDIVIAQSATDLAFTDIVTNMITGGDMVDILALYSTMNPLSRVFAKGYAADMSGYPEIMEMISRMSPPIADQLMKDGKLYGVPIYLSSNGLGYDPNTVELLGLTVDDLPKTFPELLDFLANFQADYGDEHEDINLFSNISSKSYLIWWIMNQYTDVQLRDQGEIRFDTPLFRKLLTAFEQIDFADFDPYERYGEEAWDMPEVSASFYPKESLFRIANDASTPNAYDINRSDMPLILALDEGIQPLVGISLQIMMVNAKTEHMDEAALYVAEYMKNYNAELSFALYPDLSEEVVNPDYETEVESLRSSIERTELALQNASNENKAEYEDSLQNLQERLAASDNLKISITKDEIAQYREQVTPYVYVTTNWQGEGEADFTSLVNQYRQKAIDADTFIRELDKRMNMMTLED